MMNLFKCTVLIALLFCRALPLFSQEEGYPFENEIIEFREQDRQAMPEPGGTLFIGSSSIRMWDDLEQRFPDVPIVKRGVGGCELSHFVTFYMDSIVYPYKAKQIFVYAGENDIVNGKSAKEVTNSFKTLWKLLQKDNPHVSIYFLAIKPSNSRLQWTDAFMDANKRIAKFLRNKKQGAYIDVATIVLGTDGIPNDDLFLDDKLHLNSQGYDQWEEVLRPYINVSSR